MRGYLLFQLYGPLQAWGEIAVGEVRHTLGVPTRSGILGLLAAALGIRRHESQRFQELESAYGLALRIDAPGRLLRDFHTVQAPKPPKKRVLHTRKEELAVEELGGSLKTILSTRDYLTDARFVACLWQRTAEAPYALQELARALEYPAFTLYLGRKSCSPALPLHPRCAEHPDLCAALRSYLPSEEERGLFPGDPPLFPEKGEVRVLWDGAEKEHGQECGLESLQRVTRWDRAVNPSLRQFGPRGECQGEITLGKQ